MKRPSGRKFDELREIIITPNVSDYAEGSCMVSFGKTKVLCTASMETRVPPFLRNTGKGWVTAEYGMLPRSTHSRIEREAAKGKQSGRTQEIQRLIGRSLRTITDMSQMGEMQMTLDCDVINADGGTRTASITGAYVALHLAFKKLLEQRLVKKMPIIDSVSAISCGIYEGNPVVDLDYIEDSSADADTNFVFTGGGKIIEIQGTAEKKPFSEEELTKLINLAKGATNYIKEIQLKAIAN